MGVFLNEVPAQVDLLKQTLGRGERTSVQVQAHTLKGAAANINAESMRQVAYEIEQAAKGDHWEKVQALIQPLEQRLEELQTFLRNGPRAG